MKDSKPKKKSDYVKPLAISIALHALLFIALIWGADFTMSKPEPSGKMVQAVVIDPTLVRQQAQQIRSQREAAAKKEQDRLDKLRRESEQLEKNRKAEEERIRKLKEQQTREAKATREAEKVRQQKEKERKAEELRVRQEKERAAKLEVERKAKEAAIAKAEKERIIREKAAQKAEQERVAKEKAAKEAAEKARKEKQRLQQIERERKEQEAALDNIFSGLETEVEHNSAARQHYVDSEAQRYGSMIESLIEQNLLLEDSYRGKSCKVNLRLIPTGTGAIVGNLSILDGDSRLCSATKRAIAQVGSFPLPKEQDVINKLKDINLTVEPES
ncbi:cell envelope integrity protein TolA [Vibrio hepatarius]|uniref:cell envelope integrity protein TolA n=1 Tax=Vibrio hepatarius TaxID=171383 RepID=UPI001C088492|nr:cell envelope integrity protein TolA [Vibrio hepatarius]MBU2895380.1 cell envelope integrity protein TolA [Vibrio hepatarius]